MIARRPELRGTGDRPFQCDMYLEGSDQHRGWFQSSLLLSLAGKHSLVVVEHDMAFIKQLGGKVTVLHEGSVIAEGGLETVQNDPRVIEVYLGR